MTFSVSWSESDPADHTKFKQQPGFVRNLATAIRERLQFGGMYFPSSDDPLAGEHSYGRYAAQSAKPTAVAGKGFVYTKTVAGVVELFYEDQNGNEVQLTNAGAINATDTVQAKSGDWMLSTVTTARTGWTNVSATYANKFIRISTSGLSTGGADTHSTGLGTLAVSVPCTGWTTASQAFDASGRISAGKNETEVFMTADRAASVTGALATADNVPVYVTVVIFQKN